MAEQIKRNIAYKLRISDIIKSRYIKEEGWNPNYLVFNNVEISRINLIAVVINKTIDENSLPSVFLEDGTAGISARIFEKNQLFDSIEIGDIVLIIGKPREYNGERYILPEIIKKIADKRWVNVRELELASLKSNEDNALKNNSLKNSEEIKNNALSEEIEADEIEKPALDASEEKTNSNQINQINPAETAIEIIKKLDSGNGADFDEVLKQAKEETINSLLKNGDIFEVSPGRLKVLE